MYEHKVFFNFIQDAIINEKARLDKQTFFNQFFLFY